MKSKSEVYDLQHSQKLHSLHIHAYHEDETTEIKSKSKRIEQEGSLAVN